MCLAVLDSKLKMVEQDGWTASHWKDTEKTKQESRTDPEDVARIGLSVSEDKIQLQ